MARGPGEPRVRYIAVRVEGDPRLNRRALIDAIRITGRKEQGDAFDEETGTWLTRFNERHAIIRCHHTHQTLVRDVLEHVQSDPAGDPLRLTPIATSGTIRTLVERHVPGLKDNGGAHPKRPGNPKTGNHPPGRPGETRRKASGKRAPPDAR